MSNHIVDVATSMTVKTVQQNAVSFANDYHIASTIFARNGLGRVTNHRVARKSASMWENIFECEKSSVQALFRREKKFQMTHLSVGFIINGKARTKMVNICATDRNVLNRQVIVSYMQNIFEQRNKLW